MINQRLGSPGTKILGKVADVPSPRVEVLQPSPSFLQLEMLNGAFRSIMKDFRHNDWYYICFLSLARDTRRRMAS